MKSTLLHELNRSQSDKLTTITTYFQSINDITACFEDMYNSIGTKQEIQEKFSIIESRYFSYSKIIALKMKSFSLFAKLSFSSVNNNLCGNINFYTNINSKRTKLSYAKIRHDGKKCILSFQDGSQWLHSSDIETKLDMFFIYPLYSLIEKIKKGELNETNN